MNHFVAVHVPKISVWPYKCDFCEAKYDMYDEVVTHFRYEHVKTVIVCNVCADEFSSIDSFDVHQHICEECKQSVCKCTGLNIQRIDDDELSEIQEFWWKLTGRW